MAWQLARSVVLEHSAAADLDRYELELPRFEEIWRGLEWLVARSPEKSRGDERDGKEYRLMARAGNALAGTPTIAIVYTFDEKEVTVYAIKAWSKTAEE